MLVLRDAKLYEEMVTKMGSAKAMDKFGELRILSNVLLPHNDGHQVKSIRSMFFGELQLNKMDITDVLSWIRVRNDYSSIKSKLFQQIPQLKKADNYSMKLPSVSLKF